MGGGRRQGGARLFGRVRQCRDPALAGEDLWVHAALRPVDRARRRGDLGDHRGRGRAHQRREHGHGVRYRRWHRRREPPDPRGRPARPAGVRAGADRSRGGPQVDPADRRDREAAHGEFQSRDAATAECARADRRRIGRLGRRGLPEGEGLSQVSTRTALTVPRLRRLDPLGALLAAAGAVAAVFLPFVVLKSNRIVPGDPRALLEVLPAWGALGCQVILICAALAALRVSNPRVRLGAALLGVVAVALAVAAAGDALTPAGNKVVRVSPGAGFWVLLVCLGLMATDATTRMRPGPGLRVLLLAVSIAVAGLALAHGTFDHLSVMREYAVNADRFAREARQHVWLALGSLAAAVLVALPTGILCHRVPRLRSGVLGTLNVIQTIPAMPVILTGIRIVLVQNIGMVTVAALIGGGGLGTFVFQGIGQTAIDLVLLGAIPIVTLAFSAAVVLDALAEVLDRARQ